MQKLAIILIVLSLAVIIYFNLAQEEEIATAPPQRDDVTLRTTTAGDIVGFIDRLGTRAWMGVPFAEPPVGELRWRAPLPPSRWQGTRQVLAAGNLCPQLSSLLSADANSANSDDPASNMAGSEDCLYLNIWAPANAGSLPVMFWIHGGGNSIGHGGSYNSAKLASSQRVVVVTINYRLGPLGWFSHPSLASGNPLDDSGNYGTLDVIRALRWTRDNIAQFGGNPDNVTVFGESAGAFDTLAMLASPLAKGLFHRAISQSGGFSATPMSVAQNLPSDGGHNYSATQILNRLLVADGTVGDMAAARSYQSDMGPLNVRDYLYGKSAADIFALFDGGGFGMIDVPYNLADGHVLPDMTTAEIFSSAGNYNEMPVILGTNRDEPALFMAQSPEYLDTFLWVFPRLKNEAKYLRAVKYGALAWKERGVDSLAKYMTAAGNPNVFTYRFDWDEEGSTLGYDLSKALGAAHALEIPFVFGDFDGGLGLGDLYANSATREDLAASMMSYWAQFAYTGNPGRGRGDTEVAWLSWGSDGKRSIILDTPEDQGIFMMADEVTIASLKNALASDDEIEDPRERCQLYISTFGRSAFDEEEFNSFGPDGCSQFEREDFSSF